MGDRHPLRWWVGGSPGYPWAPTAWVSLPDPQPPGSGWRPPEGIVRIIPAVGCGPYSHALVIILPSGDDDLTRGLTMAADLDDAIDKGRALAKRLGIPFDETSTNLNVVRLVVDRDR